MGMASTTALFINRIIGCATILVPWCGILPLQVGQSVVQVSKSTVYSINCLEDLAA